MGQILTNYHNIEVPASADPYQLVGDLRKMGVSIGAGISAGAANAAAAKFAGEAIADNVNLNTYTTPGRFYRATTSGTSTTLNYPVAKAGHLDVLNWGSGSLIQVYTLWDMTGFYTRRLYAGEWSAWARYATADQTATDINTAVTRGSRTVVKVTTYGADPTGQVNALTSVRNALAATPAGGTLHFPYGTYYNNYTSITGEESYVVIDKPVTITAAPGTVLQDFPFLIKGAFDAPVNLGAVAEEGTQTLTTGTTHGWGAGDYVQVISQYNPYTEAAGEWQLGSINPTNATTPECRTGEIHRVGAAPSTTTVKLLDQLIYGGYSTAAQARRIRTVDAVTFEGITFEHTKESYRGILARGASNLTVRDCVFRSGTNSGAGLKVYDSTGVLVEGCRFEKALGTFSGSAWNTLIIGGGTTEATVTGCSFTGEAQSLDVTPNARTASASDPGGTLTEYRTAQRIRIRGNHFAHCADAITSHPGTMDVLIQGNHVSGGSTGIRARSKRSVVAGNTVYTSRRGVSMEAFCDESTVSGNVFHHVPSPAWSGWYAAVEYTPASGEIVNDNDVRLTISGNDITVPTGAGVWNWAVYLRHTEPPSPDVVLTDEWRNTRSQVLVAGNTIHGGTILVNEVINGARVVGNTFDGGTSQTYYVQVDGAASVIDRNTFDDAAAHIITAAEPRAGYTYPTTHKVGVNTTTADTLDTALTNTAPMAGAPTVTEIAPGITRITI